MNLIIDLTTTLKSGALSGIQRVAIEYIRALRSLEVPVKGVMKYGVVCGLLMSLTMGASSPDGCDGTPTGDRADNLRQQDIQCRMQTAIPTPQDIKFSLERYNLARRAYWVNGMREKAMALPCPVERPIGYVVLFTRSGSVAGRFIVDGKVSSLTSWLTPQSEYYGEIGGSYSANKWLADVDGCYGDNVKGIFFFTPSGNYIEWTADHLYSDIPFTISDPILQMSDFKKGVIK